MDHGQRPTEHGHGDDTWRRDCGGRTLGDTDHDWNDALGPVENLSGRVGSGCRLESPDGRIVIDYRDGEFLFNVFF